MFEKITVIDIETPDRFHARICSIGITRIEQGKVAWTENFLIDPQCDFYEDNIRKHGIHPEDVKGKPIFPEFWAEHETLFSDGVLAGHNLSFDFSVLTKVLTEYRIDAKPMQYIDTKTLAMYLHPELPNHKLTTLCLLLHVGLQQHHNSGDDSLATANVLLKLMGECSEQLLLQEMEKFDLKKARDRVKVDFSHREATNLSKATKILRDLKGVVETMVKDGTMKMDDFMTLLDIISKCCFGLYDRYPFYEFIDKINAIVEDGEVTQEELEDFTDFCKKAFHPVENSDDEFDRNFAGKNIVLTGDFEIKPRGVLKKDLEAMGAKVQSGVNAQTDLVIVGKLGSKAWSMGSYGNKVERAKQLQSAGYKIQILPEEKVFPQQ